MIAVILVSIVLLLIAGLMRRQAQRQIGRCAPHSSRPCGNSNTVG